MSNEYIRGWNDGLGQAASILDTDETLTGVSHKAIKLALGQLKREPKADAPPVTVMTVTQPLAPNTTGCAPMAPFVGGTFTLGGPAALPNGEASGDPK